MPEGTPTNEGLDFDPNKDYVAEATGEAVESQESQEIREETEKLIGQLKESDGLFAELEAVPEEVLQHEGAQEKIAALYDRLQTYKETFPKISNALGMGALFAGLAGLLVAMGIDITDDNLSRQLYGSADIAHASANAVTAAVVGEVAAYATIAAAGVTRLIGKVGAWKTQRAIYSN